MKADWRLLILAAPLVLAGCKEKLYRDLPADEADRIVTVLVSNDISVDRTPAENGLFALEVDSSRLSDALRVLSAQGYPHAATKSVTDLFPGGGMIQSPTEEKARYEYALSQEFARTVQGLEGVIWARVHLSVGARDLRGRVVSEPTASVLLRYGVGVNLLELPVQVRGIVAGGVSGMRPENVQVVMTTTESRIAHAAPTDGPQMSWLQEQASGTRPPKPAAPPTSSRGAPR